MPRLSWFENVSPGTFEKQAQGSKPDRFDFWDERTNHEDIGPPLCENFFI